MPDSLIKAIFPYFVKKDLWVLGGLAAISVLSSYLVVYELGAGWDLPSDLQALTFGVFSLAFLVVAFAAVAVPVVVYRKARWYDARELIRLDPRAPVLYLRSFESDHRSSLKRRGHFFDEDRSDEDTLVRLLYPIGPVLTLGRPGDRFSRVPTPRLFIKECGWQAAVLGLLNAVALVVIRAGSTDGLLWEVRTAFSQVPHQNILIFLSFSTSHDLEVFRAELASIIQHPGAMAAIPDRVLRESVFLRFREDWTPQLFAPRKLSEYRISRLPWGLKEESYGAILAPLHVDAPITEVISAAKSNVGGIGWTPRSASRHWGNRYPVCSACAARNRRARELIDAFAVQ